MAKKYPADQRKDRSAALFSRFEKELNEAYFSSSGVIKAIPGATKFMDAVLSFVVFVPFWLPPSDYFTVQAREAGIKVALNTGYPRTLADKLISTLRLAPHIDYSIVAEEVGQGRPSPKMIQELMRRARIDSPAHVTKIGDTANDMLEGKNASAGQIIGVLSGADKLETLVKSGATHVFDSVGHIPVQKHPKL